MIDSDTPTPASYRTVTPWVITPDTAAMIEFCCEVFDAEEITRVHGEHGRVDHAEIQVGDSIVMLFDSRPGWPQTPAFLRVFVEDADAVQARAVAAGGTSLTAVTERFFGDRIGRIVDPFGNIWWIQSPVEDETPDAMHTSATRPEQIASMA
jgi:uncharacterized glyoxalase superfamily protein PhnB